MVQFDELRISKDSRKLIVRAHINTLDYYEHLSISGLYINTDDDRPDFGVVNTNKAVYKKEDFEEGTRQIELEIDCNETLLEKDFSQNLLFVFIKTKGTPSPCTPCGFDGEYSLGVTFDIAKLYNMAMGYIKELGDSCNISKGFIDFILQFEGLKVSIESDNYVTAVKLFKKLFRSTPNTNKGCECNGRSII